MLEAISHQHVFRITTNTGFCFTILGLCVCRHIYRFQRLMSSRRLSHILIYNGPGSNEESRTLLQQALQSVVDPSHHCIQFITPQQILHGSWRQTCCLIIFGGGYDLGFEAALGREGTRQIQTYVCAGGSYLGLCAGAYWACDYILFDKGGPLEVTGERFLKFFPGMCIGPAFPGFQYETKAGVHAVPVRYTDIRHLNTDIRHLDMDVKHLDAYSEGGGFFRLYNESKDGCVLSKDRMSTDGLTFSSLDTINTTHGVSCKDSCASHVGLTSRPPSVETLGTYSSLENHSPAIVKCRVGRGLAILSGVHIEFPCHLLDHQNVYIKPWMPMFQRSEDSRLRVFKDILTQLGVQC